MRGSCGRRANESGRFGPARLGISDASLVGSQGKVKPPERERILAWVSELLGVPILLTAKSSVRSALVAEQPLRERGEGALCGGADAYTRARWASPTTRAATRASRSNPSKSVNPQREEAVGDEVCGAFALPETPWSSVSSALASARPSHVEGLAYRLLTARSKPNHQGVQTTPRELGDGERKARHETNSNRNECLQSSGGFVHHGRGRRRWMQWR